MFHFTKRGLAFFLLIDAVLIATAISAIRSRPADSVLNADVGTVALPALSSGRMVLESSAFAEGALIPAAYTCNGQDVHPPLTLHDVPDGTRSLAITVEDPDAPFGTWTHWLIWNMPPDSTELSARLVPATAVEGRTSAGAPGWKGPCPPFGTHRYVFTLYALDQLLPLSAQADSAALRTAMTGHILEHAVLTGRYAISP